MFLLFKHLLVKAIYKTKPILKDIIDFWSVMFIISVSCASIWLIFEQNENKTASKIIYSLNMHSSTEY